MALAPYFSRIRDAVTGLATIQADELESLVGRTVVSVHLPSRAVDDPAWMEGCLLVANLLARLYPRLAFVGPATVTDAVAETAMSVNPQIEVDIARRSSEAGPSIGFGVGKGDVCVTAKGWTASVDRKQVMAPASSFATQIAACLAASELFRHVFASHLGSNGRHGQQPGQFHLTSADVPSDLLHGFSLPSLHLAGAGAIGQACATALAASGAVGHLTVVDHETIELSNLQRYLLSDPTTIGHRKVEVVAGRMKEANWGTEPVFSRWGEDPRSGPGQAIVLVALDSASGRLGVAGGLHGKVYSAYTQPSDIGWSRHEAFGVEPCLACLYYPNRPRASDDELIASALGIHRLRVLGYLAGNCPVGRPLQQVPQVADIAAPDEAVSWLAKPLSSDLVASGILQPEEVVRWADRLIGDLYSEGICGGAIFAPNAERPSDVVVPAAHQSAFAGIMLAFKAIEGHVPELRAARSDAVEGRLDLLAGLPQVIDRPRSRTPGCICFDPDYL